MIHAPSDSGRAVERIALLAAVIEGTTDALFAKDLDGRYLAINRVGAEYVDLPVEKILGKTDWDLFPPEDAKRITGQDQETVRSARTRTYEIAAVHPRHGERIYLTHKSPWFGEDGTVLGIVGVTRDVTEQRRGERALRESEALWRSIAENPFDFVVTVDRNHRFTFVNHLPPGLDEQQVLGHEVYEFVDPPHHEAIRAALDRVFDKGEAAYYEAYSSFSGRWYASTAGPIEEDGQVVAASILTRDNTEARLLEERLRRAQRMEAVGRLAGGIAHDFNNILTAILGGCDLAIQDVGPDHPARPLLAEIRKAGKRAAVLTHQLLAVSRKQTFDPKVLDLRAMLHDMQLMVRGLVGEHCELRLEPSEDPLWVRGDAAQLEQVVLNLVVNARDAMPSGGTLRIRTESVAIPDAAAETLGLDAPGGYARLEVIDTGTGISREHEPHLFEPFFTTKEPGKGTGLGLATSYGIVRQHGGAMRIESELGRGTTVRVHIPLTSERPVEATGGGEAPLPGGSETILLVEDDDAARRMTALALRRLGYTVIAAEDGPSALAVLESRDDVDLLLTDVALPGMGGRELAEAVWSRHPSVRVLFATGYARDATSMLPLLPKPFTGEALARKVREALNAP